MASCDLENGRPWPKGVEFDARPQPAAVRHDDQQPPVGREHPPQLAQQRPRILAPFEHVHEQDAVGLLVGQRQLGFVHQHREILPPFRPRDDALLGGHERARDPGLAAEGAEIRYGVTETEDARALDLAPAGAEPSAQQPAHHEPEGGGIELLEIDGVLLHGPILGRSVQESSKRGTGRFNPV